MTQTERVLELLRQGPITAMDAMELDVFGRVTGTLRLAARVADLRAAGWDVRSEMVTVSSGKRVARYHLVEQAQMELRLA